MDKEPRETLEVGAIETFMTADHSRIDRLLAAAERYDGSVDGGIYAEFRQALLRHIAMEEKVLLPFARASRGGEPLPIAKRLRSDHGALATLLVRSPTARLLDELRAALAAHNPIEEGPRGLYAACDALAGNGGSEVVARLRDQPAVPLAKYYDGPVHRLH